MMVMTMMRMMTMMNRKLTKHKSKTPMNQLVNAEVNSGNCKAVLASNYVTRIRGRH